MKRYALLLLAFALALPTLAASTSVTEGNCTATTTLVCSSATPAPPPPPPPAGPPAPGCSTSVNTLVPWTGYQALLSLYDGQSVAVMVNTAAYQMVSSAYHAAIAESINTQGAGLEFAVSRCPGDFSAAPPCANRTQAWGGSIDFVVGTASGRSAGNVCQIPAGTNPVYFNVRPVNCPAGQVCQFYFNLSR